MRPHRYMANGSLAPGKSRQGLADYINDNGFDSSSWDLIRHRIVTEYAFKTHDDPGLVLFIDAESKEAATEIATGLPVSELLHFEVVELSAVAVAVAVAVADFG